MNNSAFVRGERVAPKRKKSHEIYFLLAFAVALVMAMLWIVRNQSDLVTTGYALEKIADENEKLHREQAMLRARLAQLTTPGRIAAEATALGLRTPDEGQRIKVTFDPNYREGEVTPENWVAFHQE